jgi:DNA-binding response OmpR family regulator
VVDDNRDIRQLCVEVLADSGYEVEAASDGAAGWEALQANRYDLVITDNQMPRMTGIEMIAKLRDAKMKLPIVMATGLLPLQQFIRQPLLQPDVAMERPFSSDDLLEVVNKILRPNSPP